MFAAIVRFLQGLLASDKTVIVGVVTSIAVSLVAALGFHLDGTAVAVLTSLVTAGLGWLIHHNFAVKLREAKAAK